MKRPQAKVRFSKEVAELWINQLKWPNSQPNQPAILPAITVSETNGEVLMQAWMSAESLAKTLEEGVVCYYSRSKKALWVKGETSGHWQILKKIKTDCDFDSILLVVEQIGSACHTFKPSCFFNELK